MAGRWAGAAEARPGVPSSPAGRPGGPSGWSRDRGDPATTRPALLERPQQLCPRAGSPGAPAGPRREFGERRGFACLALCVRTHTTAYACCLSSPSYSYPRFALRSQRGPRGWPGGGGKARGCGNGVEVTGLALSPAPPSCLGPPLPGDGVEGTALAGRQRDPLLLPYTSVATATLAGCEQRKEARGLDQTHTKCKNVAGRV